MTILIYIYYKCLKCHLAQNKSTICIDSARPKKLYSQPASFRERNTFLCDFCIPADSQPGNPAHHHKAYHGLIYHHK